MSYGLKYQSQFTSQSDANNAEKLYTLQFLYKDYTGGATSIDGGDVTVIQKCTIDDPFDIIKGQSLSISLINKGNIPITVFQSEDDNGVQVKLLDKNNNILFIGFLVQDDFYELMVDYAHVITLSANDGLGLLKGVILSEATARRSFYSVRQTNGVDTVIYVYVASTAFYPKAGNTIEFLGNSYIIATAINEDTVISSIGYNWTITVTTTTGGIAYGDEYIYLTGSINLLNRNRLIDLIAICLGRTNLSLITNIFLNIYEYRQDNTITTFEQTLLDSQLFISGETYKDCYVVLTTILQSFNCSLFQANGQWNIVHWNEANRYTANAIPGFQYDESWISTGTTTLNNTFFIGPDPQLTRPATGLTQGAFRGYKFTRKQFDYKTPKYLLKNYDFLQLGDLLREYTSGIYRISEYVATNWLDSDSTPYVDRFIRVVYDTVLKTEASRILVAIGDPGDLFTISKCIKSKPIDVQAGDQMKLTFSFRGSQSFSGGWSLVFAEMLNDGTQLYYIDELPIGNEDWKNTYGWLFDGTGMNTNEWHEVEMTPKVFPASGLFYVYLTAFIVAGAETQYKDIRFEYIPYINDSTKIIGHIHKQNQLPNKKLNLDETITIDETPRNSIEGTLFLETVTGLLQDRTTGWRYPDDANGWKLGELTTLETLTWRQKTRSKYEGEFIGNYQTNVISLLSVIKTDFDNTKNYIPGMLSIDYKRNKFSGTLWELYDDNDSAFDPDYTFNYIYSTT